MLISALLIVADLLSASFLTFLLCVVMSIAGIAMMIIRMATLFGSALRAVYPEPEKIAPDRSGPGLPDIDPAAARLDQRVQHWCDTARLRAARPDGGRVPSPSRRNPCRAARETRPGRGPERVQHGPPYPARKPRRRRAVRARARGYTGTAPVTKML